MNSLCQIPNSAVKVFQNLLVNSLSWFMMNFFDSPWLLTNFCSMMYINTDAVADSLNRMNIIYFVSQFTIISMLLNLTPHVRFFNDDNFTMKFIVTDSQGLSDISSCLISSYLLSLEILFHQYELHLVIISVICSLQFTMLHLCCMRSSVCFTSKCSVILLLWHFLMIFSSLYCDNSMWNVTAKSFIKTSSAFSHRIPWCIFLTPSWSGCWLNVSAPPFSLSFL